MSIFSKEEIWHFLVKVAGWLFTVRWDPVIFFRHPLFQWKSKQYRLFIKGARCERATDALIHSLFEKRSMRQMMKLYMEAGAEGWVLYNEETWIGYIWSVDLSLKETSLYGQKDFSFVGLPKNFKPEGDAYWGFAAEVHPKYQGKGAFLYLQERSYGEIQAKDPEAVVYSNVDVSNHPSLKNKKRAGESPVGIYRTLDVRIFGRHFSNIYCSKLSEDSPSLQSNVLQKTG